MARNGVEHLNLLSVVGFSGADNTLILHPDGRTLIYPLGSAVVLRDLNDGAAQEFLQGHTDRVTALALSRSGRLLASGQAAQLGFAADVVVWDLAARAPLHRLQLQKVKIQALAFSPDETRLASLGGADDGTLVLWDAATGAPVCGAPTGGAGFATAMAFLNCDGARLVTAGDQSLTLWEYDAAGNRLVPQAARLGQLRRAAKCLAIDADDALVYAGTGSGDVLQVSLASGLLRAAGPAKAPFALGVTAAAAAPGGAGLLVGSGDGAVALLSTADTGGACANNHNNGMLSSSPTKGRHVGGKGSSGGSGSSPTRLGSGNGGGGNSRPPLSVLAAVRLEGGVSSIAIEPARRQYSSSGGGGARASSGSISGGGGRISSSSSSSSSSGNKSSGGRGAGWSAIVGTRASNIYRVAYDPASNTLSEQLLQTAHAGRIAALAFPAGYGGVFATAGPGSVRLWHAGACRELLRIAVPNLDCKCLAFASDGSAILTGWSDGRVRAFGPQSGRLLYAIHDAHHKGVSALAATADPGRIITGGEEGMVRVWRVGKGGAAVMEASLKDHKGAVNAIAVPTRGGGACDEAVSASSDGSCIVWDLAAHRRRGAYLAPAIFTGVAYGADDTQIVAASSDRKLTYLDAADCAPIRVLEASASDPVTAVAVAPGGGALVTGGADRLVKIYGYDDGVPRAIGAAHSGAVAAVAVSPDRTRVVSVGAEGGVCIWALDGAAAAAAGGDL